jgi:hypothetical protein
MFARCLRCVHAAMVRRSAAIVDRLASDARQTYS